jgi:radical SAM superfamily enzyme with C-terminal helix-hairpin-helix motif
MKKVVMIDGYVDEPTCLGVPPYISPYPRYIAGAIKNFDKSIKIFYLTIDQLRKNNLSNKNISDAEIVILISGISVPGRYLSGFPISPREIEYIFKSIHKPIKILCGPSAKSGFGIGGGKKPTELSKIEKLFDLIVKGDCEIVIGDLLKSKLKLEEIDNKKCRKQGKDIGKIAIRGAGIVLQHPFFPDFLIAEIETYRGCTRSIVGGCSFCSEPNKGPPDFRPIKDIVDEIGALYKYGIRHFRIGDQPCIFSYMAEKAGECEFPKPNPDAIEKLFRGIRSIAPDLKTLHIDNANPGIIARFPNESIKIAKSIINYHTSGDVAAFGVESVDPVVIKKNNLKASGEEVLSAIKILNKVGVKKGANGLPELLPGINFIFGLIGETKETYDLDYDFLKRILEENLLIRRINLRQVIPNPGTRMEKVGIKILRKHKTEFQKFKIKVKETIEKPLLEKLLPKGTILKNVITEKHQGKLTLSRQMGSYPLLVGIPGVLEIHQSLNVIVSDYGYRSVTAFPCPLDINTAKRETIEALPNIGKKRAIRILANRPFATKQDFLETIDDKQIAESLLEYIIID